MAAQPSCSGHIWLRVGWMVNVKDFDFLVYSLSGCAFVLLRLPVGGLKRWSLLSLPSGGRDFLNSNPYQSDIYTHLRTLYLYSVGADTLNTLLTSVMFILFLECKRRKEISVNFAVDQTVSEGEWNCCVHWVCRSIACTLNVLYCFVCFLEIEVFRRKVSLYAGRVS